MTDLTNTVRDGDQRCPRRGGEAGAAHGFPRIGSPVVVRVVDRHASLGIAIEADIGNGAAGVARSDVGLIGGFWLDLGDAAAAITPDDDTMDGNAGANGLLRARETTGWDE